jgi:hypothetical protein
LLAKRLLRRRHQLSIDRLLIIFDRVRDWRGCRRSPNLMSLLRLKAVHRHE